MPQTLGIFVLSMLAYILTGQLGLKLSIPPGFASAVWPATGVALALALRFPLVPSMLGTALGSFIINLAVATGNFADIQPLSILVAAIIGLAALLQTLAGHYLFRRCIGEFSRFSAPAQIVRFVFLVAGAGYTVSCSISTLALLLSGTIPESVAPFTWLTWWIGDSLGVMFFAPFLLTLMAPNSHIPVKQKLQIVLPTLVLFLFTWAMFSASLHRQQTENELRAHSAATELTKKIDERLQHAEQTLSAYSAFFNATSSYNWEEFEQFSKIMLENESALYGVGWTEIIPHSDRQQKVAAMRNAGFSGFRFTELTSDGKLVTAAEREEYYPVLYIYPLEQNRRAFGLNLGANPARKQALQKAKSLGKPVATAPIILAQETAQQKATILYRPILNRATGELRGFVSGVMRIESILGETLKDLETTGFSIILSDTTDATNPSDLIRQDGKRLQGISSYLYSTTFGERNYQLELFPNTNFQLPQKDWTSWMVLTGGFLIAALVQMFIMALTGNNEHIKREVEEKTRDLHKQTELAQAASKAKTEFLSNMSHELRTPLNAIIGLINLCRKTDLTDKQSDYLSKASLASSTLLSLINQTLDHAKIEAGRMELGASPFSINQTINKLIAVFELAAREKHIDLSTAIGSDVPEIAIGDPLRVEQILLNLLGNAMKFTQAGSVRLSLDYNPVDGYLFEVRDTGSGIPPEYHNQLFSAFSQADSSTSRRFGGTGLGLTISYKLAHMMGGKLELASSDDSGSCFRVTLPLQPSDASVEPVPAPGSELPQSIDRNKPLHNLKLLLVEDTPLNQMVAEELLTDFGASVVIAGNGAEALESLERHPEIDLVLMDIQMPVMDGFEAARQIRRLARFRDLPIVAMTANAMEQDVALCLEAGMNDHISKPIDPEILWQKIVRQLASGQHSQSAAL